MTAPMLVPLLPLILPSAAAILAMLAIGLRRSHAFTALLAAAGLLAGLVSVPLTSSVSPRQVTPLVLLDGYALLFLGLFYLASLVVILLSYGYFEARGGQHEELYVLLLTATVGSATLAASTHFVSFFLGLEILSVSLYALLAYERKNARSLEAGIKYLILAASSAAFLLFGFALIYAESGTMDLAALMPTLVTARTNPVLLAGLTLALTGVGFKLALVPFHLWTADVYEGSPAPVTAFLATVSKGAMFAVLLRFFLPVEARNVQRLLEAMAIASILFGNLLALRQANLKRLLAYSSIAHFGYMLIAFLAGGREAISAIAFYLCAYFATLLVALGVVGELSVSGQEVDTVEEYRGLYRTRPFLSGALTVSLLSLAGIPLTAGFIAKYTVLAAAVRADLWLLLFVLVVGSAIGLYYYLRIVVALFQAPVAGRAFPPSELGGPVVGLLLVAVLFMGIFPDRLLTLIQRMVNLG